MKAPRRIPNGNAIIIPASISRVLVPRISVARPFSITTQAWAKQIMMEERVKDLSPACQGCGTALHTDDSRARGYYSDVVSVTRGSVKTSTLSKYNLLMSNLDPQSQKVLLEERTPRPEPWEEVSEEAENLKNMPLVEKLQMTTENSDKVISQNRQDSKKEMVNRGLCTSCRSVKGGKYEHFINDRQSDEKLLAKIPKDATLIHVINGMDFPASVNPRIKDIAAGRKILWVVTKADMILPDRMKINERLLPYVQEELSQLYGANPDDVFVVSPKRAWEMGRLYSSLPLNGYLVGYSNTGKTSLALALARKDDNREIIGTQIAQRTVGANEIPGMTREPLSYVFKGKRLTDMPPIGQDRDQIYSVVKETSIKELVRGKPFMRQSGLISTPRLVLGKAENTLSIAGLVFIRRIDATKKISLITWSPVARHNEVVWQFKDLEKAMKNAAEQKNQHEDMFFNKPYDGEDPALKPIKVMSLSVPKGGIDLSILGLCHVQLRGNGPIPDEGVALEIYAVPGVQVVTTIPITPFLVDLKKSKGKLSSSKTWNKI